MFSLMLSLTAVRVDRRAVTALEYGLIAGVIVAAGLAGFSAIGGSLANTFATVATELS